MKQSILLLLFLSVSIFSFAQKSNKEEKPISKNIVQPNRVEFAIDLKDGDRYIISANERGLLTVNPTSRREKKGYVWEFYMLDTLLGVVWNREYVIPYTSNLLGYDYSSGSFYLLFGKSQYKVEEMEVMELDIKNGNNSMHQINTVFPMQLTHFESLKETLIFAGYANSRPVVMLFDTRETKPKVLPGFYNNKSDILDIKTDDATGQFSIIMSEISIAKVISIAIKTYKNNGDLLISKTLIPEYEKSLLDGSATSFSTKNQYVAGIYANKKSKYSRGLYIAKIQNNEQEFINYYNYAELENFFSYMRARREKRVKERITRRKINGKKLKFNYKLLVHDIIQRGDEFVMIGEAYYPKYSNTTSPTYFGGFSGNNDWGNPTFQGYRYTHAVVVGFDKKGNVLWDNSFEINDVLSYELKELVKVTVEDDKIIMLYVFEDVIRAKVIKGNEILEGKSFNPIALSFQSDEITNNNKDMEGLEEWYGNYFYASGTQKIKNLRDKDIKINRKVFYINKIKYQ